MNLATPGEKRGEDQMMELNKEDDMVEDFDSDE